MVLAFYEFANVDNVGDAAVNNFTNLVQIEGLGAVDKLLVLLKETQLRVLVTAADVLHSLGR